MIKLPSSPLRAAKKGEQGLAPASRLYGWEYVPCPVEAAADFTTDLADPGDGPKNTARWILTLPGAAIPDHTTLAIDTRNVDWSSTICRSLSCARATNATVACVSTRVSSVRTTRCSPGPGSSGT